MLLSKYMFIGRAMPAGLKLSQHCPNLAGKAGFKIKRHKIVVQALIIAHHGYIVRNWPPPVRPIFLICESVLRPRRSGVVSLLLLAAGTLWRWMFDRFDHCRTRTTLCLFHRNKLTVSCITSDFVTSCFICTHNSFLQNYSRQDQRY